MHPTDLPQATIEGLTPLADWLVVLPLVTALLGAALLLMIPRVRALPTLFALLVVGFIIACEVGLLWRVYQTGPLSMTMGRWLPPFGISFVADLFSATFALTAAVATFIVLLYAEGDRKVRDARDPFQAMVLLLLAGVTGSFLTGDLFNLYVWFEVMLIASFGLFSLSSAPLQLDGAVKYGFLNFLATTLFLLSLGLLYGLVGTLNMADILLKAPGVGQGALLGVGALLLLALGMKAAAFPLNAWLPASYHAPAPAIAALFAGLVTKVGIYALLRALVFVLPQTRASLEPVLLAVAVATLLVAPLGAIAETNLRRAIGFLVISGIGSVLVGITLSSSTGLTGAGFYIVHAMLSMTALYLVAGLIERLTGTNDTRQMGGLYADTPVVSILFLVLVLAAAGIPPSLGFWPKLLLIQAGLEEGGWTGAILAGSLIFNAVLTVIAGSRLWAHIFLRPYAFPGGAGVRSSEAGNLRMLASTVIVGVIVAVGLWPNIMFEVLQIGVADLIDPARYVAAVGLAGAAP